MQYVSSTKESDTVSPRINPLGGGGYFMSIFLNFAWDPIRGKAYSRGFGNFSGC